MTRSRRRRRGGAGQPGQPGRAGRRRGGAGRWPGWLLATGTAVVVAVAGVVVWVSWPRPAVVAQARQYLDVSACLLTDPAGVTAGTAAVPVWAAMQSASVSSHVMVTYLADTGPGDAGPMLNALVQRQCGVIIVTGAATAHVAVAAKANPHQHFLLVTASGAAVAPGVVTVSAAGAPGRIRQVIGALASGAPTGA